MSQDLVTIVIPTFNQLHHTKACLAALQKTLTPDLRAKVYIIDNASQDGTQDYLAALEKEWPLFRWWGLDKNCGFNYASNLGAEKADSDYLVFLNNDTIPQNHWLESLLEPMSRTGIGIVGPKLVFPETGLINHAGYVLNRGMGGFYPIYQNVDQDCEFVNRAREYQALLGACLLMKRSLFFEVGGFDDFGLEDIALCLKVREKGLAVLYYPKSVVLHVGSATIKGEPLAHLVTDHIAFNERWPSTSLVDDDAHFYRLDGYTLVGSSAQGVNLREDVTESKNLTKEARELKLRGAIEEAIQKGMRAVVLYPYNTTANVTLIEMLKEAGQWEAAKGVGLRFLAIEPTKFSLYKTVLQLCEMTNDREAYNRLRNQALEYPDFPMANLEGFS